MEMDFRTKLSLLFTLGDFVRYFVALVYILGAIFVQFGAEYTTQIKIIALMIGFVFFIINALYFWYVRWLPYRWFVKNINIK